MALRRLFLAAPGDEVELRRQARQWVQQLSGGLPSATQLRTLTRQHGTDFATAVLDQALRVSERHGAFIQTLDAQPTTVSAAGQAPPHVLIVPGMFYRQHPESGADGRLIIAIARRCGFTARLVTTRSLGRPSRNSVQLSAAIRACHQPLWLISLSRGGAEVRLALQQDQRLFGHLKGWINIAGLSSGTPLADGKWRTPGRRIVYRLLCRSLGIDPQLIAELTTGYHAWQQRLLLPKTMVLIHIIGLCLEQHLSHYTVSRYRRLSALGPNDGLTMSSAVLQLPGHVYPVWGADHFMRSPEISPLLYRLFRLLAGYHAERLTTRPMAP